MRRATRYAPAALAAALLLYGWIYLAWNGTVGAVFPAASLHLKRPMGFDDAPAPDPSAASLLDGAYQRATAQRIGVFTPIYRDAVQWKTQIYYSVFGVSGLPSILIGRHTQLLEMLYVDNLCRPPPPISAEAVEAWARRLRAAQDRAEARGQVFVYLLTPSKPAVYPEWLPNRYPCQNGEAARNAKLARARDALANAGVHVADAVRAVEAARRAYPAALFPRGGIHWNDLGAAIGAQTLIGAIARPDLLAPFTFDVQVENRAEGDDRDLLDILNLKWPDNRYPVPRLEIRSKPGPCRPVRIAEATGSFLFKLNETLERTDCPPEIDMWFYWGLRHYVYKDGARSRIPPDAAARAQELDHADVVIVEENETGAGTALHLREFLDWEEARSPGGDAAR